MAKSPEVQLDQWLDHVLRDGKVDSDSPYFQFCLPSSEAAELFLGRVAHETDDDVRTILRHLLLPSCSLGTDDSRLQFLLRGGWKGFLTEIDFERTKHQLDMRTAEFDRRLLTHARDARKPPPWEGITWVLDLLPGNPQEALDALSAYYYAHIQLLPDGRLAGMEDALAIIRARYVGLPGADVSERLTTLLQLSPRQFEYLIERYFAADGYETTVTAASRDGGRDILASRESPPPRQYLLVECKNWNRPVSVAEVRHLFGVVGDEKAPHGVLVGTLGFTGPALAFASKNPRLTLLGKGDLVRALNGRLGTDWPERIDRLVVPTVKRL